MPVYLSPCLSLFRDFSVSLSIMDDDTLLPGIFRRTSQKYRMKKAFKEQWPGAFEQGITTCDLYIIDAIHLLYYQRPKNDGGFSGGMTAEAFLIEPITKMLAYITSQYKPRTIVICYDEYEVRAPYKATERARRRVDAAGVDSDIFGEDAAETIERVLSELTPTTKMPLARFHIMLEQHKKLLMTKLLPHIIMPWLQERVGRFYPHGENYNRLYVSGYTLPGTGQIGFARITQNGLESQPTLYHALAEADHQIFWTIAQARRYLLGGNDSNIRVVVASTDTDAIVNSLWYRTHDNTTKIFVRNVSNKKDDGNPYVDIDILYTLVRNDFHNDESIRALLVMMAACGNDYIDGVQRLSQTTAFKNLWEDSENVRALATRLFNDETGLDVRVYVKLWDIMTAYRIRLHDHDVAHGAHFLHVAIYVRGIMRRLGQSSLWYPDDWSDWSYNIDTLRIYR